MSPRGGRRNEQAEAAGRRVGQPRKGQDVRKLHSYSLPPDLIVWAREEAVRQGKSASDVVAESILTYLIKIRSGQ